MNTDYSRNSQLETDEQCIRAELSRILEERRFSGAPQMSAFLRYIVNETLAGNADRIKAFSVGVDALGKPDSFDAQSDPSVRVLALRLRNTLAAFYRETDECIAVIELRVGTYVPSFYQAPNSAGSKTDIKSNAPDREAATAKSTSGSARATDPAQAILADEPDLEELGT